MKQTTIKTIKEIVLDEFGAHLENYDVTIVKDEKKKNIFGDFAIIIKSKNDKCFAITNIEIGFSRYSDNRFHSNGILTNGKDQYVSSTIFDHIIEMMKRIESTQL